MEVCYDIVKKKENMKLKKLYRSDKNKIVAGVFGGLGEYIGVDPVLLRVAGIFIFVFTGFVPFVVAYLLLVIVMPKRVEG